MVTVLFCGTEKGTETKDVLLSVIRSLGASALHVTSKSVSLLPPDANQADFLILDNTNIQQLHADSGVVIFRKELNNNLIPDIPENFIAVMESENEKAVQLVKKYALQTVTCGLSQRDTLTFSSISPEKSVISLQREICDIEGRQVLPQEISVNSQSEIEDFPFLAVGAVLLLSGFKIPEEGLAF